MAGNIKTVGGYRAALPVVSSIALALTLSACATRGGPIPYDVQNFGTPDLPARAISTEAYRIGVGDTLAVQVYNVPEFSGDFTVDEQGVIAMPLLGKVPAQGTTADEVKAELTSRLTGKYLQSPNVFVTVKEAVSQRITIDGSVTAAGIYPLNGQLTLLQAVSLAKGPTADANPHRVVVFRTIDGQRQAAAFDLDAIRHGQAPDPAVYGNDIVVVDGSKARQTFRDFLSAVPLIALFRPF